MAKGRKDWQVVSFAFLIILSYVLGYFTGINLTAPSETSGSKFTNLTDSGRLDLQKPEKNDTGLDSDLFKFTVQCSLPVPSKVVRNMVVNIVFNGIDPYLNFPPPYSQRFLHKETLWGWGSYGPVFERLIRKVEPRIIVEVGSFLGASAIHMANVSRRLGLSPLILCVDDFRGFPGLNDTHKLKYVNGDLTLLHQFMYNVKQRNFSGTIMPVPYSSTAALWQLCYMGVAGDLIVVDAGHDFHLAWTDINLAYKILKPGGVLFGHDYYNDFADYGVRRAVNLFAKVKGMRVRVDGEHWILEPK